MGKRTRKHYRNRACHARPQIGQIERGQQRAIQAEPTPFWDTRQIDYAFTCADYFDLRGRYSRRSYGARPGGRQRGGRGGSGILRRFWPI